MNLSKRRWLVAALFLVLGIGGTVFLTNNVQADDLDCSSTITITGNMKLTHDLTCTDPIGIVINGGRLNLNHKTLTCAGLLCVSMGGAGSVIMNGKVDGGSIEEIVLGGGGCHIVRNVTLAAGGVGTGIRSVADGNLIAGNDIKGYAIGIDIRTGSTDNTITRNDVTGNTTDLSDKNADCDNNNWSRNDFKISDKDCIE